MMIFKQVLMLAFFSLTAVGGSKVSSPGETATDKRSDRLIDEPAHASLLSHDSAKGSIKSECCFVSSTGSDSSNGLIETPFATLQHCVDESATCYLRGGSYHEEVLVQGKSGLLITNYGEEEVTFDGTTLISNWEVVDSSKSLYAANGQTAWQLFMDGKPMAVARYPNADPWSAEAWNHDDGDGGWLVQSDKSTPNHMVDGEGAVGESVQEYLLLKSAETKAHGSRSSNSLAAATVSFNGCPVVLNTGHWDTKVSIVENHTAGTGTFDHADDTSFTSVCCDGNGRYFIEGCEAALDTAGEWTYAANTAGRILFMSPAGGALGEVRGKVQTYAMTFVDSSNIELRGINFFATTFVMYETSNSLVADCTFDYSSYHRRALNETEKTHKALRDEAVAPKLATATASITNIDNVLSLKAGSAPMTLIAQKNFNSGACNVTLSNNEFGYTSGTALKFIRCNGDTIENNLFHNIGDSAAGEYGVLNLANSGYEMVRRNVFDTTGGSEVIVLGKEGTVVEFNYFTKNGLVQSDGASIHAYKGGQNMSIYRYNWVVHSNRGGFRFDAAKDGLFGSNGTIHHNVAFQNKYYGFQIKGWDHKAYHNTGVDDTYMDVCLSRCYPASCELDVPAYDGATAYNNQNSTLAMNVGRISSKTAQYTAILPPWSDTTDTPPSDYAPTVQANVDLAALTSLSVQDLYMGAYTGDWRPRAGSVLVDQGFTVAGINDGVGQTQGAAPDIGAYEAGGMEYWIPGRQSAQASMPVPFDKSIDVNLDVSLMFLPGTGAASHEVFWAKSGDVLQSAGTLSVPANIKEMSGVEPGATYTWRVDAIDAAGKHVVGPEWSFTAMKVAIASFAPSGDTYVYKNNGGTETAGTDTMLVVFKYNSGKPVRMTYLKFDLSIGSRLTAFQAKGYQLSVTSATLKLYVSKIEIPDLTLWAVSDTSWDENTTNYNNKPALGEQLWSSTASMAAGTWVSIPLGSHISQLSGTVAFALTTTSTNSATQMRFDSKEGSNTPKLDIGIELR